MKNEINKKLLAACKRAFDFVDDEFNNKTVVEMNGSFGLWLDLKEAIEFAERNEEWKTLVKTSLLAIEQSKEFFTSNKSR